MTEIITIYFNKLIRISIVNYSIACLLASLSFSTQAASLDSTTAPPQPSSQLSPDKQVDKHPPLEADKRDTQTGDKATDSDGSPEDLWERIREDLSWHSHESARIDKARQHFLRQSGYLPMVADRSDYYLHYIVEEVQKRDMPMEIVLIPMIESGMDPFASSPGGAAGLWQITPATGRHLGLEQSASYDGRHALRDSTTVALDYLETLHEEFDEDWLLALAAYNSGAGNVARAREVNAAKGLDTDYWSLNLPGQAQHYVPKLIALAQIVAHPDQFDVEIPTVLNAPAFEIADTGVHMGLARAADLSGVDIDTLRALNPGQLRGAIAPNQPPELLLPIGTLDRFEDNIAQLGPEKIVRWQTYRIMPGDSLSQIAIAFDTDVAVLRAVNGIRGSTIRAGDTLKIPRSGREDFSRMLETNDAAPQEIYRVRAGDSLYRIADKFNVSVSDLITWNALDPNAYLRLGQELTLTAKGG